MSRVVLRAGDLTATVGDNGSEGRHRAGYNGVWELRHRSCERSLFVPEYAGLNLEHIFDGDTEFRPGLFFEPRTSPMELHPISETEAELYQPETPATHVESWTRFRLTAPHYVDMSFRFVPHKACFQHGYVGVFWASYIHAPEDKSMYFLGGSSSAKPLWTQLCTQVHNDESTVRAFSDDHVLKVNDTTRGTLYNSMSPHRFAEPFFYGTFEDLTWLVMFERGPVVRLSHSPSGGGVDESRKTTSPAWDHQLILPTYEVGREYTLRVRAALMPRCTRDAVLGEVATWAARNAP